MTLMLAAARNSSIASRFARGPSAMIRGGGSSLAQPAAPKNESRQIATTRPASMVPSRAPKSDSAGAVIGSVLPVAATLAGARVLDRTKMGKAVEDYTGAKASDVLGAGAVLLRLSGLDASVPSARAQITRTIQAKVIDWGGRAGDGVADAIDNWEASQTEKKAEAAAKKADAAPAAKVETKVAAEVNATP